MPDPVVEKLIQDYRDRSEFGLQKYGVGLDRSDLSFLEWMKHHREELMDATLYALVLEQREKSMLHYVMQAFVDKMRLAKVRYHGRDLREEMATIAEDLYQKLQ